MTKFFVLADTEFVGSGPVGRQEELFVTDGTADGTQIIEVEPDLQDVFAEQVIDGQIVTVRTGEQFPLSGVDSRDGGVVIDGKLYFAARNFTEGQGNDPDEVEFQLAVSDGTPEGTQVLIDPTPEIGESFEPEKFEAFGDKFFFVGTTPANGREIYVSDGTAEGTKILTERVPGDGIR